MSSLPKKYQAFLDSCVYAVEATGCEELDIWSRYCDPSNPHDYPMRFTWDQYGGWLETVGELDDRPINVCLMFNKIGGQFVCFWHPVSQLVDYAMIDEWFTKHAPLLKRTNAMNVHHALHHIQRLNEEKQT